MRIRIVGGGAVGMLLAGCFAKAGHRPELIVRSPEQGALLQAEGLAVQQRSGERFTANIASAVYEDWSCGDGADGEEGWVFLTVKQTAVTDDLARRIAAGLDTGDKLLCFQNGIGHEEILGRRIPPDKLYFAVTTEGARKISTREVAHTGSGITYIGQMGAGEMPEDVNREHAGAAKILADMMKSAGFQTKTANNMKSRMWSKLMINAVINPLTALLEVPNGALLSSGPHRELMESLFAEACEIARAAQVELQPGLWRHLLDVCESTASNRSSMLQDIMNHRPTEIEWIQGSLIRHADSLSLQVPALRTVYRLVKAKEVNLGRNS